jgi:leucyl aminopeptidase
MDITVRDLSEEAMKADLLVLPFFEDSPSDLYSSIDTLIGGLVRKVFSAKEFTGKLNQLTLLHVGNINADRVLLAGLGKQADITADRIRQAGGKAFAHAQDRGCESVALSTTLLRTAAKGPALSETKKDPSSYFLEGGLLGLYRFEKYKKPDNGKEIKKITVLADKRDFPVQWLTTVTSAVNFAKDMIMTPSNDMTPSTLGSIAKSLASRKVKVTVLDRKAADKKGMGAYLALAKGSAEQPQFIIVEYKGGKGAPLVLVGKAITFDSGGLSIKPAEGMEKMKYDMAGGATVLAVIKAAAELSLPLNVTAIIPAAENMPGGKAYRPGDVLRTITGKTVEIISTDAEGRLALADAIGYAVKYCKPSAVIDIATLTGACSIAFGNEAIAMMGTSDALMERLREASKETYERVWEMPLYEEYKDYLKSDVADMKNAGGRSGALVSAGYFLKEFAGEVPWVHLDIAGTSWNEKDKPYLTKGATAVGVRLLLSFLEQGAFSQAGK